MNSFALILIIYGVGAALGGILGGKLADRFGSLSIVKFSLSLMALSFLIMIVIYSTHHLKLLSLNLFLISLVSYGFFPALQACAAQIFVVRRPTVLGLLSSCLYIGITLASALGEMLFAAGGMAWVLWFSLGLAVGGLTFSQLLGGKYTHQSTI